MIKIIKKIFLIKKIDFKKYKKREIVLFDNAFSKELKKIIPNNDFFILFANYEYLNLRIILKLFFSFKLNSINYFVEIIKEIEPKIVITFIDNNENFWRLKKIMNNSKIKFVTIQNGWRINIFKDIDILAKDYFVDDMFFFNKNIANIYSDFIDGNTHVLGSFKNNFYKIPFQKEELKSKSILFISQINPYKKNEDELLITIRNKKFSWKHVYTADFFVLKFLHEYCSKRNIQLNILGRNYDNRIKEETMFRNFLGKRDFNYIINKDDNSQYDKIQDFDLLTYLDSTLGYEALSRSIKSCAFSIRGTVLGLDNNEFKFGWPAKLDETGFFWTNQKNMQIFENIINQVNSISQKEWMSKIGNLSDELMFYSPKNEIFSNYLKKNNIITYSN